MYAKKTTLAAFFYIFLFIVLHLISALDSSGNYDESDGELSYSYYRTSCPSLELIVSLGVWKAVRNNTRNAASLLRLLYLDCFVNGCDASVLLDDNETFEGEQNAVPNQNSIRGLDIIDRIKKDVELVCPNAVSCADILALAARDAVLQTRGPFIPVPLGRLDGLNASKESVIAQLPSPSEPLKQIAFKFLSKGLDVKDLVVLSGAHTIGFAQCFEFRDRLYNYQNSSKPDPSMDTSLLPQLQSSCTTDANTSFNLAALDTGSDNVFDNTYYKNLVKYSGVLQSDQVLMTHPTTAPMVQRYSANPILFSNDFVTSMTKLGKIGVITDPKEGGEIRTKCGSVN